MIPPRHKQPDENCSSATTQVCSKAGVSVVGIGRGSDRPTFTFTATAGSFEIDSANTLIENVLFTAGISAVVVGVNVGVSDPSAGGFQELGRVEANWENGQTHSISLEVIGSVITVYADDVEVMTAIDDDNMGSTFAGIFSRGDGNNKLESFTVNSVGDEET